MTAPQAPQNQTSLNFAILLERIVPLMAELLATLAARDPLRMRFANVAEQTILDMIEVLRDEGFNQGTLAAAMGMTVEGYRRRLRRLREEYREDPGGSSLRKPGTLLEQVYDFVADKGEGGAAVTAAMIQRKFRGIKEEALQPVLATLVAGSFLMVSGRGEHRQYRVVPRPAADPRRDLEALVTLYWEGPLTAAELAEKMRAHPDEAAGWLDELVARGQALRYPGADGQSRFRALGFHIAVDAAEGYEMALWDHLHAVIAAICMKIRLGRVRATPTDHLGGTTFSFDIPEDDPLFSEVAGFLAETRTRMEDWRRRSAALVPEEHPGRVFKRVTIYTGQMVEAYEAREVAP